MEPQKILNSLEQKRQNRSDHIDFKVYCKAIVIQTTCCFHTNKNPGKKNRLRRLELNCSP